MDLSVDGLTDFFKHSAERQITADPSIKFSGEEMARVSVAVGGTFKQRGENKSIRFSRLWKVAYHDGHWKITSDNNAY